MPVNIFEPVTNPISGETFKGMSFSGDAFVMKWIVQPKGYVPFEHTHLNQEEVFYVETGEIKVVMDGKEFIAKSGESITVPKGLRHIAFNNKESVLNCRVAYRPGLDYDKFMQCLLGLTKDGILAKNGGVDIPRMGYFLTKMKARCIARPTAIPAPLFKIALKVFYIRGVLSGWKKLYDRYTQ
jgi:quercetin dioxygenase-like cupin family protein